MLNISKFLSHNEAVRAYSREIISCHCGCVVCDLVLSISLTFSFMTNLGVVIPSCTTLHQEDMHYTVFRSSNLKRWYFMTSVILPLSLGDCNPDEVFANM